MAEPKPAGGPLARIDRERRQDNVTRREFEALHGKLEHHMIEMGSRMDTQDTVLAKINVALFATDDKNEQGQPGLMVTARNIDNHITVVCKIGKWAFGILVALLGIMAPVVSIGHNLKWW